MACDKHSTRGEKKKVRPHARSPFRRYACDIPPRNAASLRCDGSPRPFSTRTAPDHLPLYFEVLVGGKGGSSRAQARRHNNLERALGESASSLLPRIGIMKISEI